MVLVIAYVVVCTPSRAAILTGRMPIRTGVNDVLPCDAVGGPLACCSLKRRIVCVLTQTQGYPKTRRRSPRPWHLPVMLVLTSASTLPFPFADIRDPLTFFFFWCRWHLGQQPKFAPTRNGFNYHFGIPYAVGTQQLVFVSVLSVPRIDQGCVNNYTPYPCPSNMCVSLSHVHVLIRLQHCAVCYTPAAL